VYSAPGKAPEEATTQLINLMTSFRDCLDAYLRLMAMRRQCLPASSNTGNRFQLTVIYTQELNNPKLDFWGHIGQVPERLKGRAEDR
jgi:hypothetical protein